MPSRRHVVAATFGIVPFAGCAATGESGNIQLANRTDRELWIRVVVRSDGGVLSDSKVVFDERFRFFPTDGTRATLTDVARPGRQQVQVTVRPTRSGDVAGQDTTWWTRTVRRASRSSSVSNPRRAAGRT